jgi:hypothetical protein
MLSSTACRSAISGHGSADVGRGRVGAGEDRVTQQTVGRPVDTPPADYQPTGYQSLGYRAKNMLLGPPLATSRLVHERLRKLVALAVFSSDAISSTAYGTEQIMLVLVAAGAVATHLAFPIALAIGALLAILVLSYRQTITATRRPAAPTSSLRTTSGRGWLRWPGRRC